MPIEAALQTEDEQHYQLTGFGPTTSPSGSYEISIKGDITDPSGNSLVATLTDSWVRDTGGTPPPPPPPPPPGGPQVPYTGTPFFIPATGTAQIQFEDFDNGGEGIAYHDTTTANEGGAYRTTNVDIQPTIDSGAGYNVA
jgi:hypothetical protein